MFEEENVLGIVEISVYKNYDYHIYNTFKNNLYELFFLLYMIDRILSEMSSKKIMNNFAALLSKYLSNSKNTREEFRNKFINYNGVNSDKVASEGSYLEFKVRHELRSKIKTGGEHLYIWSDYVNLNESFDVKITNATFLYLFDFIKKLEKHEQKVSANSYDALLQIYLNSGFPTLKSITNAPFQIVRKLLNS